MPTYSYLCDACNRGFELEQRISDPPTKKCPRCGKLKARRMISSGNFILKGGGWYSDGYGSTSSKKKSAASSESSSKDSSSSSTSSSKESASSSSSKEAKPASNG